VPNDFGNQGLEGPEIIEDLVAQFRKALQNDGIFRPQDSYSRGYSAKISYHVDCYGLDKESAEREILIGMPQDDPDAETADDIMDILQEENISKVRDRIEDAKQGESDSSEESEQIEVPTSEGTRQKRKYTRKLKLASPGIIGGAEDFH